MNKLTEAQLRWQVDHLNAADCQSLVASVLDALYGPTADSNWSADTLDAIAQALDCYGLGPNHVPEEIE